MNPNDEPESIADSTILFNLLSPEQQQRALEFTELEAESSQHPRASRLTHCDWIEEGPILRAYLNAVRADRARAAAITPEWIMASLARIAKKCEEKGDFANAIRANNELAKLRTAAAAQDEEVHRNSEGAIIHIITNPAPTMTTISAEAKAILERSGFEVED